jgi:uncharacterized protein YndB with AHSA1/START domain
MNTDSNAPLYGKKSIVIDASPEKVWNLQSDINNWSKWQPDVPSATLQGKLEPGTTFRWKGGGLNITSKLHTVDKPTRIGWTGDSIGMHAVHNWTLEPVEGGTRVTTEESITGWLARVLKLFDPNFMSKSLEKSLQTLKTQTEIAN